MHSEHRRHGADVEVALNHHPRLISCPVLQSAGTADDYETVWIPRIEAVLREHGTVRMLLYMDEGFAGWELGAAWDDAKVGLRFQRRCERIAVVGGPRWVDWGTKLVAPMLHGEVRTFAADALPAAWDWIRS